jgi:hypothetical protein
VSDSADTRQIQPEQAAGIVACLLKHGVRFVVVGAFGAIAWGAPIAQTRDIDATPAADRDNLERLATALEEVGALIRVPGPEPGVPFPRTADFLEGKETIALTSPSGEFDLTFMPDGTAGYEDLVVRASYFDVAGVEVPVADLGDIIRSKWTAFRPKDREVVPRLVEYAVSQGIDPFTVPGAGRPPVAPKPLSPEHARRLLDHQRLGPGPEQRGRGDQVTEGQRSSEPYPRRDTTVRASSVRANGPAVIPPR